MTFRKRLIEVALPIEAINQASARERSVHHGHPSRLHLWWARRPLAAARAVIFSQMVDDPSEYVETLLSDAAKKRAATRELRRRHDAWRERQTQQIEVTAPDDPQALAPGPEPTLEECAADLERERLFEIIRQLVRWENTTNETVLQAAWDEIWQSWRRDCAEHADHPRAKELFDRHKLPGFHDPFAGGGALPLEAQRLGLESYASDLNPVAVLINKAMIEIPPKFAGWPPVNPASRREQALVAREWRGAQGLAEDVRYYGQWMRDEADKRIGHFYPKVEITAEMARERPDLKPYVGKPLTVIAWLWARTVKSPNPAFAQVDVPLASTFMLSIRSGKEVYVEPVIEGSGYCFTVKVGTPWDTAAAKNGTKTAGANFQCLMSGTPIPGDYIKAEGKAGRMSARLMAMVAEGARGRVYLPPTPAMEDIARQADPQWKPEIEFFQQALGFRVGNYGMARWSDLFTPRQLVGLATFSDLGREARERARHDALDAGLAADDTARATGECGATAYANAIGMYLAFAVDKCANYWSALCSWRNSGESLRDTFGRQAIPIVWDYAEGNPFCSSSGNWTAMLDGAWQALETMPAVRRGFATQAVAQHQAVSVDKLISTDPPYYDNIGYADLSDFFYVWLRRALGPIFPDLFATLAVPKEEELVATPARHGGRQNAERFFLDGMTQAMHRIAAQAHPSFPVTIYYAFKQSENDHNEGTASTGWETFLEAVIRAGFAITGTWPVRTELANRMRSMDSNALASSVVLVCRPRAVNAPAATFGQFRNALRIDLPPALTHLQRGNIAPVDLAQAAIGPGMAVYTRYARVLNAEGQPLSVREALALINQTLDEVLAEQEEDIDGESRWALAWFGDYGFADGPFGDAHTYFLRFNTAQNALVSAGIIRSGQGNVRLIRPDELPVDWDPDSDPRLTAWEVVHHLIRVLEAGGESAAATLAGKLGTKAETARELCYRLYTLCERKKRAPEALVYNGLVQSWPEITRLAREGAAPREVQASLF